MKVRRLLPLFALSTTLVFGSCATDDPLDRFVHEQMQAMHLPGLALAVVRDGEVVTTRCYGEADLDTHAPVTTGTVFEIGSLSKQFTAMLVMMLVEEGRLRLDDPITRYVDDAPASWSEVQLHHLLTHTSGLPNYLAVPGMFEATTPAGVTHADVAALFARRLEPQFEPGSTWSYSNTGYLLLGHVIERVTGASYWEILDARILAPLGMRASGSTRPDALGPGDARGYEWRDGAFAPRDALTPHAFGAGSIVSTLDDLVRWDAALADRRLLSPAGYERWWTPARATDGGPLPSNYAYGWTVDLLHGKTVTWHSGGTPGFSSLLHRFEQGGISVIVLTNHGDRVLDPLARDVAAFFEPTLARPTPPIDDPRPDLTRRAEAALLAMFAGDVDPADFTVAMQAYLRTPTGHGLWSWVGSDGRMSGFAFVEEERDGALLVRRYRARLGDVAHSFSVTTTATDHIAQVGWW